MRADPEALAPECLLVFKVKGTISDFARAVNSIPGLELVDEQELEGEDGETPVAYLMVPDQRALQNILSLWQRWLGGQDLGTGNAPWRNLFGLLTEIRRWGPEDRVDKEDRAFLLQELQDAGADGTRIHLEVELVYRQSPDGAEEVEGRFRESLAARNIRIVDAPDPIRDIAYHALLVEAPVSEVRALLEQRDGSLVHALEVMHIRPQSLGAAIRTEDIEAEIIAESPPPDRSPILALMDGATVSAHPLLNGRTRVEDVHDLDSTDRTPVERREHGTAMASLIIHGDLNSPGMAPLPRQICTVPVMQWNGAEEELPAGRLIVDLVYRAVLHLRSLTDADILIVNLSLGNLRRPFHGRVSPWARLLDWLAWEHGILFVVSAGNDRRFIPVTGYTTGNALEDDTTAERPKAVLRGIDAAKADRRIISPAETINGITVGALNRDAVPATTPNTARRAFHPYASLTMANPSSRLGPGFANAVKPDILAPGGREHLRVSTPDGRIGAEPIRMTRAFGLKVAAPPRLGTDLNATGASGNTSGATALASRTAHRIHDALEEAYGERFMMLPRRQRALILKALLVHPARWNQAVEAFIREVVGPADGRQHVRRKDNIRRYLGYGAVDEDTAVACAADRATFWATGTIGAKQSMKVEVPIPACIGGEARPHSLSATVAWFAPIRPGSQRYRAVRLKLLEPEGRTGLRVEARNQAQPDQNQSHRGTVISRVWSGHKAPVVTANMTCPIIIQREPDMAGFEDEEIPFGLAVTLEMQGVVEIYEQVRQRLGLRLPVGT